jgi:two-component system response regulator NreC
MDKIRVLLVDDHPVVRKGVRAFLEAEPDMDVVGESSNGADGVQLAQTLHPDVVVMDISMSDSGLDATRAIRAACPATQVLIFTVYPQERYLFHVLKAGAAGFLSKASLDTQLVAAIRTVAQGGAFLYPGATRMLLDDYLARVQAGEPSDAYDQLSERERQVLKLIALGYASSEIAEKLILSPKSVETYRTRVMQKLNLHHRAGLVQYALAHGLLSEEAADAYKAVGGMS